MLSDPVEHCRIRQLLMFIFMAVGSVAHAQDATQKEVATTPVITSPSPASANTNTNTNTNTQRTYESLSALSEQAKLGDVHAQLDLAEIFERGQQVTQNFEQAFAWRKLAAEKDNAVAQNALGRHYAEGLGTDYNPSLALRFMKLAAEQGAAQHQHDYALLLNSDATEFNDEPEAVRWYALAARQGFVSSIANLGFMYFQGRGVGKDTDKAMELLENAAAQGHAHAQNNLGLILVRGDGVEQNYEQAFKWFEQAALQGLAQAKTNLAVMYENGFGVQFNEEKAQQLYREGGQQAGHSLATVLSNIGMPFDNRLRAFEQSPAAQTALVNEAQAGDPVAQYLLAHWLISANNPSTEYRAATSWFEQSARSGMSSAMLNLGVLYMAGRGVPQDYVSGYYWISNAAGRGYQPALEIRDTLFPFLTTQQIQAALSLEQELAIDR